MIKSEYNVIGVMSGTSLDGVDLVYANFKKKNKQWVFKILCSQTVEYSKDWHDVLKYLVTQSIDDLHIIDQNYTEYLSGIISIFIKENNLDHIDAICSHGHTALHQPQNNYTLQLGNKKQIAELLEQTVVCDFRIQDVKFGGQGAPLVPIGDKLLFGEHFYCLNLGGFANISFDSNKIRYAFDICPANIVLNQYCRILNLDYDFEGKLSSKGIVSIPLLNKLNALEYYQITYPKSLGVEWVNQHIFPLIDSFNLEVRDVLRTFVEHIAVQISKVLDQKKSSSVLLTGGGTHNSFLLKRISSLSKNQIIIPKTEIIDYKEALVFGLLGVLRLRNEVNCLASVTGAKYDHSSGFIYRFCQNAKVFQ